MENKQNIKFLYLMIMQITGSNDEKKITMMNL